MVGTEEPLHGHPERAKDQEQYAPLFIFMHHNRAATSSYSAAGLQPSATVLDNTQQIMTLFWLSV